jgi:hypothetical protein
MITHWSSGLFCREQAISVGLDDNGCRCSVYINLKKLINSNHNNSVSLPESLPFVDYTS